MRPICNSILRGWCLLVILPFLSGCFPEGTAGCPEDLFLSFRLEDRYEEGDYDSRVTNDIYLYIFQDQLLAASYVLDYEDIKGEKEYIIPEKDGLAGNLDYVAWAVAKDAKDDEYVPVWSEGKDLSNITMGLKPTTRGNGEYHPVSTDHYTGTVSSFDRIDEVTRHKIDMGVSACRVEVNITDFGATVLSKGERVFVGVNGTMSQMTMRKTGTGQQAVVVEELKAENADLEKWSTGRFGVLPSSEGQTVSVDIFTDGKLVETLRVPSDNLPRGAEAGGLLIFDYTLGEAFFFITIEGFTQKIVIIDEM